MFKMFLSFFFLAGLQKIGVTVALINFNLRYKPLSHSVLCTEPKVFFVGAGKVSVKEKKSKQKKCIDSFRTNSKPHSL
jgi:hypothetical protein